jgi:hypothetical protein
LILPYSDRFLQEIANINQASTQWTLAQLFDLLETDFTSQQKVQAQRHTEEGHALLRTGTRSRSPDLPGGLPVGSQSILKRFPRYLLFTC